MDDYDFFNNSLDNAENNPSNDPNAIEIPDENISDDFDFSTLTEPKNTDEEKELTEFSVSLNQENCSEISVTSAFHC